MKEQVQRLGRRWWGRAREATVPAAAPLRAGQLLDQLTVQIRDDHIRAHAGNLAFRGLFSIFAALIVTFALLALFEARELIDTLLARVSPAFPKPVVEAIREQILATTKENAQGAIGIGTAASIGAAVYGLSAAARAVIDAMNSIYEIEEERPFISRYVTSVLMAFAVIGLLIGALLLVAIGPQVGRALAANVGLAGPFELLVSILRWPILVALVLLACALVYAYAPAKGVGFRFITHGSLTAAVGWLLFSVLFSFYVERFGSFNATYGALAGIAMLLLYMYFASFIMLVGAEMNDVIRRFPQSKPGSEGAGLRPSAPRPRR